MYSVLTLTKIKNLIAEKDKKTLIENFFSLSFLQIATYILPLITLPYLVRVLGPEKFGLIAFSQAFIQYFMLLTDFGFNLSATREISIHREDKKHISKIFVSVFIIKLLLLLIAAFIIIVIVNYFGKFNTDKSVFYLTSLSIIGWVMFPQWFFQGIENMKFVTLFNVSAKLFFTICIFTFVKSESDYLIVPLLNSIGLILSGLISVFISLKYFNLTLQFPSFLEIKFQFLEGWHIFLSNISINLYTTSNNVILGLLTNNTIVGYYSAAEWIFKAFQQLGMPIYQSLFPYLSKLYIEDSKKALLIFNKLFKITLVVTFFVSLFLTFLSPLIVKLLLGDKYQESIIILSLLSWVIFASWGNYTLGIQGLVNFGHKKKFTKYVLICGIFHIIVLSICIQLWGYIVVPIVWFVTESLIFSLEYRFLKKIKIIK